MVLLSRRLFHKVTSGMPVSGKLMVVAVTANLRPRNEQSLSDTEVRQRGKLPGSKTSCRFPIPGRSVKRSEIIGLVLLPQEIANKLLVAVVRLGLVMKFVCSWTEG